MNEAHVLRAMLHLALMGGVVACVAGATVGAYALVRPFRALALMGLQPAADQAPAGTVEARSRLGGLILAPHGVTGVVLAVSPRIGACMAAALALAWFGAAAVRAFAMATGARDRRQGGALVLEAAMGVVLAAPLWLYLEIIRADMASAVT
ncbi:DUF4345 domain-containing protein [Caulobacter sp. CCUG 60055]|uniref:DUF4345 domain-containing protein n=1 Tax=Caulobacter sp. CCUG 60055 TaxID=2100090 RepID=UPI001FA78C4B|nr:DUF4345 domain-containing protein [Caulobacter sp. CCUG 60055]MCI3181877.1 DUF4345 domain-containing protein [Caulobacter sp. CCUG 60055]